MLVSPSTHEALSRLTRLKPYDGWSVEYAGDRVRLLRRNIALTTDYFLDLHYDPKTRCTVGVISSSGDALSLVDAEGLPIRSPQPSSVQWQQQGGRTQSWNPAENKSNNNYAATSSLSSSFSSSPTNPLSDQENLDLIKMAGYLVAALVAFRVLFSAMFAVYVLAFPLAFFYALQTCPSLESFDAKKELKRVMRGHHLPEDHPDKPKGWFNETYAKVAASVATELATGLGYEVTQYSLLGACHVSVVRVPSVRIDAYWIGVFGKWRYLGQRELPSDKTD